MSGVEDLAAWLTAVWDEEEWWATEASRRSLGGHTPTGEHWHWECNDDHPATPEPLTQEILECAEGNYSVSLRSIEEYPTDSVGPLPHFALSYCEEVPAAVAGHILRHDPASVLARIAADRKILAHCMDMASRCSEDDWPDGGMEYAALSDQARYIVRLKAEAYQDRPGFRPEWLVERQGVEE